jgi:sec-independent protein translocase protein TatC
VMGRLADDKMSFMEHLGELRTRIVRSLIALLIGLGISFPFAPRVIEFLARPVKATGNKLVFITPTEAFWTQMKVALICGLFLASPGILWQVWRFVAPGLYGHEKKYAAPFVVIGSLLFIGGGAFALLVIIPLALPVLLGFGGPDLVPMLTIGSYFDFILKFTLAFGAIFEVPLALTLAARLGVVTPAALAKNRKYAIFGCVVAAAVLTPTGDAFNMALMAGPLIVLYEIGIVSARVFGGRRPVPKVAEETST